MGGCWGIKPNVGAQVCGRPDTGISFFVYIPNKNSLSPKSFRVSSPHRVSLCSSLRASRTSDPCFRVLAPSSGIRARRADVHHWSSTVKTMTSCKKFQVCFAAEISPHTELISKRFPLCWTVFLRSTTLQKKVSTNLSPIFNHVEKCSCKSRRS